MEKTSKTYGRPNISVSSAPAETGCRVVFPTKEDESSDSVLIIGRKENAIRAKEMLTAMVKEQVCMRSHTEFLRMFDPVVSLPIQL